MHFVKRSACPKILEDNQEEWTKPWMAHYCKIPYQPAKKPASSHWLKNDIRLLLIEDFHKNCGHCGINITKSKNPDTKTHVDKGDVDHFLPKRRFPEKTYDWLNYIWSCKSCNQSKKETYPLLNPCSEEDCQQIVFIEDTGEYVLSDAVKNDKNWQLKFSNSEKTTLLNAQEIAQKRKFIINLLKGHFKSISNMMVIRDNPIIENEITKNLRYIKEYETSNLDFYFLIQIQYQKLIKEYPEVDNLLI